MARIHAREMVQKLRKHGRSIRSIADRTGISRSTVSYWCRDIVLSEQQIRALMTSEHNGRLRGLLKATEEKRTRRLKSIATETQKGGREVGTVSKRDLFMIGLALYWGEGYKKSNDELGFTNSDPRIIRLFIKWLSVCYGAQISDLIARVSINASHIHRTQKVLHYWSDITHIPLKQFSKTSFIKTTAQKEYQNMETHFGTLRIKLRRGTNLRRRILGSIDSIARSVSE